MSAHDDCGCGGNCCTTTACGCCEGVEPLTPEATDNRPWLSAIKYRVGVHASFLESMKARLSLHAFLPPETPQRPLDSLTTRDATDPAIAMLDGWATVADVLTFYQERIANEAYLRTATELRSVYEMARLVGYRPRPGVAASVYLAYTIDSNTKEEVLIPLGARAQSVPGPGETAESFEASEALQARALWNVLKPRTTVPQRYETVAASKTLYIKGLTSNVKVGDPLLIVSNGGVRELYRVTKVDPVPGPEPAADLTNISLELWVAGSVLGPASIGDPRSTALDLMSNAPRSVVADRVMVALESVQQVLADPQLTLSRTDADAAIVVIDAEVKKLGGLPAPKLRAWLNDLRTAIDAAAFTPVAVSRAAAQQGASFESLAASLTKRPSQPLSNALRLDRSLAAGFKGTSDAGLQVMGAVAPSLKDTLGLALTSTMGTPGAPLEVYAFRVKAGVFGRNAQKRQLLTPTASRALEPIVIGEWPIVETIGSNDPDDNGQHVVRAVKESPNLVFLEGTHEGILPGSWMVALSTAERDDESWVTVAQQSLTTQISAVDAKVTRAEYGVSGEATRIMFKDPWLKLERAVGDKTAQESQESIDRDFQVIRATTVFAQSEKLELAEAPFVVDLCGGAAAHDPVELNGLYQDLQPGRFVVVSGERRIDGQPSAVVASEPLMITDVVHDVRASDVLQPWSAVADEAIAAGNAPPPKLPGDKIHTFVWFDKPLSYCYRRDAVTIYGNVVKATHGETRTETLGNGDGAKANQTFSLKQSPLTYVAASTAKGAESTLQVFVNDVRWRESETFIDKGPTDHAFVTKTDSDAKTDVIFGNGYEGSRLPTGIENVKALYRIGIGKGGNARAGQITTLSTRPLGVKEVINPLRASGGADREGRDHVRRNAPNAVLALDRLVATRDYADFARGFAGIAKASAVELSDGRRNVVHVTIAGMDDVPIDPGSDLFINLGRALRELGDPFQPIELDVRELLILIASAKIRIHPDYRWEIVVAEVRARLLEIFSFDKRDLTQDVTSSEVLAAMQAVRGVAYVDLDAFGAIPSTVPDPNAEDGRRPATPEEIATSVAAVLAAGALPRVRVEGARLIDKYIAAAQIAVLLPGVPSTLVLNQIT